MGMKKRCHSGPAPSGEDCVVHHGFCGEGGFQGENRVPLAIGEISDQLQVQGEGGETLEYKNV